MTPAAADTAGVTSARACRSEPGPFVSPRNRSNNNATGDLVAVMMALMMEHQQRAEEEREDRGRVCVCVQRPATTEPDDDGCNDGTIYGMHCFGADSSCWCR
jgi:hypothetical protein